MSKWHSDFKTLLNPDHQEGIYEDQQNHDQKSCTCPTLTHSLFGCLRNLTGISIFVKLKLLIFPKPTGRALQKTLPSSLPVFPNSVNGYLQVTQVTNEVIFNFFTSSYTYVWSFSLSSTVPCPKHNMNLFTSHFYCVYSQLVSLRRLQEPTVSLLPFLPEHLREVFWSWFKQTIPRHSNTI